MFGFIFALIYLVYLMISSGASSWGVAFPAAYLVATAFLLKWYIGWAILVYGFMLLALILMALGVAITPTSPLKKLLILATGGAASVLGFFFALLHSAMIIGGTYLLHTALVIVPSGVPQWDTVKMVCGAILLVLGLMMSSSKSSSS